METAGLTALDNAVGGTAHHPHNQGPSCCLLFQPPRLSGGRVCRAEQEGLGRLAPCLSQPYCLYSSSRTGSKRPCPNCRFDQQGGQRLQPACKDLSRERWNARKNRLHDVVDEPKRRQEKRVDQQGASDDVNKGGSSAAVVSIRHGFVCHTLFSFSLRVHLDCVAMRLL